MSLTDPSTHVDPESEGGYTLPPKPKGYSDTDWPYDLVAQAHSEFSGLEAVCLTFEDAEEVAADYPKLRRRVDQLRRERNVGGLPVNGASHSVDGPGTPRFEKWASKIERDEIAELASITRCVNTDLNTTAMTLGRLHMDPANRDRLRALLIEACNVNGYIARDGEDDAHRSITSGFNGADKAGQRYPPDRPGYDGRDQAKARRIPAEICTAAKEATPNGDTLEAAEAGFWEARESLSNIRDYALACMVSPWGLLGTVLIYTLDFIPQYVALPGIADDDSPGSLNLFLALVGPSGANKGRTCRAARRYIGRTEVDIPPGSGEGLVKIYVRRPTPDELNPKENDDNNAVVIHNLGGDQFVYKRHNAVVDCAEVQSLAALGSRTGSTLHMILRQGFSGETLGFGYSDESKRLLVPADQYRLTMIVGVQPEHSDVLLNDAAGGTPQRFLWTPVTDRRVSRHNRPAKPKPTRLVHPTGTWPSTFGMCEVARDEIEQAAEERAQGVGDPLDGHALFVRAKVAAALAVLDGGRVAITDEDWRLAGSVMAVSDRTRARCADTLVRAAEKANEARGRGEGIRASVAEETTHVRATQRVVGVLVRASAAHGPMKAPALRKRLAARDRRFFDDALALAIEGNQLIKHEDGQVKVP